MTLPTAPSSTAAPRRVNALHADVAAMVCAGSAGVHAALVVPHAEESPRAAVAFALVTAALALAAGGLAVLDSAVVATTVAGLLLATAAAYAMSRTAGIPVLGIHPEPVDELGSVVTSLEVAAAWMALRSRTRRRST